MVAICGPSCPLQVQLPIRDGIRLQVPEPLLVHAETLEEALASYTRRFGVRFRPYDGSLPSIPFGPGDPPKFFFYERADGSSILVDIHIERGTDTICPKQDLGVRLQPTDRVNIGRLAC